MRISDWSSDVCSSDLLDTTQARVGNVEYARDNRSFGLTTLRDRHVKFIRDGRLRLNFIGKGGTEHDLVVDDRRLARIVRRGRELPGHTQIGRAHVCTPSQYCADRQPSSA